MTEAVIVATARSPIGRAIKGSLVDLRPDDMSAQIVRALMDKVPEVQASDVEDLIMGCGQPAGEAGFNVGRMVAGMAGLDEVPGVTVNRYCSSSLQTIRMAAHAIKAGEGDCFISAGVEAVSRYGSGASDTAPNPIFEEPGKRTALRAEGGQPAWTPPESGLPDFYIAMGQTAENVREIEGVTREEMDEFGARSQQRAVAAQQRGHFENEITPLTLPDGTIVSVDDGPRDGTTAEKLAGLKPVFRPDGEITAGNACPLNDGAAAVMVMSDTRAKELGLTPLARIVSSGVTGLNPEIMGLGPIEASRQAMKRAGMTRRRHRPRRDQRGVRRAGDPVGQAPRFRPRQGQRERWSDRARSPVRHDRRTHHDDADQQPPERGQDHRPRDHVCRRRSGHGDDHRTPLSWRESPSAGGTASPHESRTLGRGAPLCPCQGHVQW